MNMRKKASGLMALLLSSALLFAGCGEADTPTTDPGTDTPADSGTNGYESGIYRDDENDVVSLPAVVLTENDELYCLSTDDRKVSFAELRYFFMNLKYELDGGDEGYWEEHPEMKDVLLDTVIEKLKLIKATERLADEFDCHLTEEERTQMVDQPVAETINQYNSTEGTSYAEQLEAFYLTDQVLRTMQNDYAAQYKIYAECFNSEFGGNAPTDQEVYDYIDEQYVRVKHILFKTTDADDEEKTQIKSLAESVLARARDGEEFESLVSEYSEDGMDVELGYVFTYGTMVSEFETASYALEEGEISDLVESAFGYHIIKRYPITEQVLKDEENAFDAATQAICGERFDAKLGETIADIKVEYFDNFEELWNGLWG